VNIDAYSGDSVNKTVSGQRLGKHVPATINTHVTIELLLETGCFLCGPCRDVITRAVEQRVHLSAVLVSWQRREHRS
jgi:hypothetical protein